MLLMLPKRFWNVVAIVIIFVFTLYFLWYKGISEHSVAAAPSAPLAPPAPPTPDKPRGPIYKNKTNVDSKVKNFPPIADNFPLLKGLANERLPSVPSWNQPPSTHVAEKTPLFIGFTRNWPLLQQCVLSYITAGWPPEDIYVIDNTGTFKSNFPPNPKITLQNPFYLNVERLTDVFKINVISTPTLLSFAQLQNFYIYTAIEHGWDYYWWSHMDILALAEERFESLDGNKDKPYRSLYMRAVERLREVSSPDYLKDPNTGVQAEWGIQFFAYDWLALNNVKSFLKIGAWDTFVSYYTTDCDMHGRFHMAGIQMPATDAGRISDIGNSIDLNLLFRRKIDPAHPPTTTEELNKLPEDDRGKEGYDALIKVIEEQTRVKNNGEEERNSWQYKQTGGQGEPFYRDPQGFEWALQKVIAAGVDTYHEKWGFDKCDLGGAGLKNEDAWQVEKNY